MDLTEAQLGKLTVNIFGPPTVGKMIQHDFHDLDPRAGKYRHVVGTDRDMGVFDRGHGLFSLGRSLFLSIPHFVKVNIASALPVAKAQTLIKPFVEGKVPNLL